MLSEAERPLFRTHIIPELEKISDADSDTLADYVLELLKSDGSEQELKDLCLSQLEDFLGDNTRTFVDEAFASIESKSYDPNRPPVRPAAPVYPPPRRQSLQPSQDTNASRKRAYHDWDTGNTYDAQGNDGVYRPVKQSRRGRPNTGHGARQSNQPLDYGTQALPAATQLPPMPLFDPNDPISSMLAMHQAMGLPLPPFPGMPTLPPNMALPMPTTGFGLSQGTGQRCRDYDTEGYCTRGVACPFEHGENPYVVPTLPASDEYDPNNAVAGFLSTPTRTGRSDNSFPFDHDAARRGSGPTRARGRGSYRGGKERAPFSHIGNLNDPNATSVVVEGIPRENFDEKAVRAFFSQFGDVLEVTMQPYKRLAIVKFGSHDAARAAYNSPKSVFDNRFVKVYWYNPDTLPRPANSWSAGHSVGHASDNVHASDDVNASDNVDVESAAEPELDLEEIARRQEEAQKRHEDLSRQREEAEKKRRELDEKLKAMDFDRKSIAARLAQMSGKKASSTNNTGISSEDAKTRALKEQLAKLEAEATSIGINPDPYAPETSSHHDGFAPYRGRGGYRGRGAPRGRGYFSPSYRGGYHSFAGTVPKVKRLDNRPKTVSVTFTEDDHSAGEDGIRQYLMFNDVEESAEVMRHPERSDMVLVSFSQRFEGENFIAAAVRRQGPLKQLGKVELGWYTGAPPANEGNGDVQSDDVQMGGGDEGYKVKHERTAVDMDTYDENEDNWM